MKTIVLVTWKAENYGTCLQLYALYKKLESMGYKIIFLPYLPYRYNAKYIIKNLLKKIGVDIVINILKKPSRRKQLLKTRKFHQKTYIEYIALRKKDEQNLVEFTDCFISGSDQIWNTYYQFDPTYFLDFAGNKKRVAYASSIGTNSIKAEYREEVKQLLLKYSHIGVRENGAVKVLSELTGRTDIEQVLDPTFLLSPEEWGNLAGNAKSEIPPLKNYILCYFIGNNDLYKSQLQEVKEKTGISNLIIIPSTENPYFSFPNGFVYKNAGPEEFVDLIQRATLVCTDSFHATALSINHSIPFVEFMRFNDNETVSQNMRIYDLLRHYGLMNRIYVKDTQGWADVIDYRSVQDMISEDRIHSIKYLINAIEH